MDPIQPFDDTQGVPPTQNAQTPMSESPQKSLPVMLLIVIGIVVLFVGLLGGYFLSKTLTSSQPMQNIVPTPTLIPSVTPIPTVGNATMNTYTNSKFGITFQYPLDWKTVRVYPGNASDNSPAFVGLAPANITLGDTVAPIYVEEHDNPNNLSLKEFEDDYNSKVNLASTFYYADATPLTVGGFPAYRKEATGCEPLLCTKVTVMAPNKIFILVALQDTQTFNPLELAKFKDVYNNIVASVTFMK